MKTKKISRFLCLLVSMTMVFTILPMTAFADSVGYYGEMYPGRRWQCSFGNGWAGDVFYFSPSTTGWYEFYCDYNNFDNYGYLVSPSYYGTVYNSLVNYGGRNSTADSYCLTRDDDSNGNRGYRMRYLCYAGQGYYYFSTKYSSYSTGDFIMTMSGADYSYVSLNRNGGDGGSGGFYTSRRSNDAWLSSNSSSATNYITPPTRQGYTFTGYFNTSAPSGGTQYVASNGALMNSAGTLGSQTLYARWQQSVYTLTFNNQGVANTSTTISSGTNIPESVAVPVRTGYQFNGYYGAASGGTQYYNNNGTRISNLTMNGNQTLYAQWTAKTYTITYAGLEGAALNPKPVTHTYNAATVIPKPTKTDYTFMGWYVNSGTTLNRDLTLSPTGYTANISLTANWKKTTDAIVQNPDQILTSDTISKGDLEKIFNVPVDSGTKGVTTDELNTSASVNLTLKVSGITGTVDGEDAIKKETNGEVVKFFDVKVVKEVTTPGGTTTTTTLTEVPSTIEIRIPLTGDMIGKSSYQVLRYHTYTDIKDGQSIEKSETHKLSDSVGSGEYYTVEGNNLVIRTRMFSTYAIAAGQTSLGGNGTLGNGTNTDGSGVDVQARMSRDKILAIYKIDVEWGPMVFEYTTSREWDPINHVYMGASYDWAPKSFENGNNRVTLANHSNADVNVDFAFAPEKGQLDGVDVSFREINSETAPAVSRYYLPKVPQESAAAPTTQSFLWLRGTPTTLPGAIPPSGGESEIAKVGVINVTIAAQQNPILTPKS